MAGFPGLVYGMQKLDFSINSVKLVDFVFSCVNDGAYKASLTTTGRKTGREHTVWLRAVIYQKDVYFSRRNENADWLKNAASNPSVRVGLGGTVYPGMASVVSDQSLAKKISTLKYPGEARADEARIVLRVELDQTM
jgi:hypothetical protein